MVYRLESPVRILWTLFKVMIGLAIAIPLGFFAVTLALGVVGTAVALAVMAVRLAVLGLVGYGIYRVARFFVRPSKRAPKLDATAALPPVDPYYTAAMRELDAELRR